MASTSRQRRQSKRQVEVRPGKGTLDEYAAEVQRVWHWDKQRPVLIAWLTVAAHASELCEEVRKATWGRIAKQLAEVTVWWLSFVQRVTTVPDDPQDLITYIGAAPSDIVWFKYPNVCPVCFSRLLIRLNRLDKDNIMPAESVVIDKTLHNEITTYFGQLENAQCTCLSAKDEVENRTDAQKKNAKQFLRVYAQLEIDKKPSSLHEFSDMFKRLFANNTAALTMEEIAFHLLEEVGEVADALTELHRAFKSTKRPSQALERQKRIASLAEELADVFSWSNCLLLKLARYLHSTVDYLKGAREAGFADAVDAVLRATDNLESLIWRQYGRDGQLRCEGCHQRKCTGRPNEHNGKSAQTLGELDEGLIELFTAQSTLLPDPTREAPAVA